MTELWWHTIIISALFLLVFGIGELAYLKWKVNVEYTRKFIHSSSGLLVLTFPTYIDDLLMVGLICALFFILLLVSLKFKFLNGLNAIERKSHGALLFPIAVFILYVIYDSELAYIYFYLPILVLAISDPLAALSGKKWPIKTFSVFGGTKSIGGVIAFSISASVLSIISIELWCDYSALSTFLFGIIIGSSTAVVEAFSVRGLDNLSVPLWVVFILIII